MLYISLIYIQAQNAIYSMLSKTFILLLHHSKREHFDPIVNMLLSELDDQIADIVEKTGSQSNKEIDKSLMQMSEVLAMLTLCVTVRKASRITGKEVFFLESVIIILFFP